MQIHCPTCHQTISFEGTPPKFCSQCGQPFPATAQPFDVSDSTVPVPPPDPAEMPTLPPARPSGSTAKPVTKTVATPGQKMDDLPPNTVVGHYSIVKKLGQGGMGSVFEAKHETTGQPVALKLLSRSLLATDDSVERFQRESQIAASINHPRSTFVYEAGQFDDQFYITMELMSGGTLKDIVESQGQLPVEKAVDYVLDIIDGLQRAHDAGIVHRDLKPSNCFVDHEGRVKIGDFGLAKSFINDSNLTQTGTFMGTPQFAAPEQLRASDVDERADIYALGGTLFYLLAGRAPFVGHAAQVIASIASDTAPNIRTLADGIPQELARIIQQSLEKDPSRRQQNLLMMRNALLPFSTRGASKADLSRRLAAFFIDLLICGIFIVLMSQFSGVLMVLSGNWFAKGGGIEMFNFLNIFFQFGLLLAYFAIPEWRFGRTLGKWLMGMRVINSFNEPPKLFPALLRASMVPGLSQLVVTVSTYLIGFDPQASANTANASEAINAFIELQLIQTFSWVPSLIFISTARQINGFRGIHDFLTGTRVVRLAGALESRRPQNVPVTIPTATGTSHSGVPSIESLEFVGRFRNCNRGLTEFFLARDQALDRDVWALSVNEFVEQDKKQATRSTLIRTVARHEIDEDNKWLITEAIKGCPLLEYIQHSPKIPWSSLLPILQEVVDELIADLAASEKRNFHIDQFWIDITGHVTFLNGFATADAKSQSPVAIIQVLLDAIIENHVIPEHALTFRDQLALISDDPEALKKIEQRLELMEDLPSVWRWDDRAGVAAATFGMEYSPIFSFVLVASLVAAFYAKLSPATVGLAIFSIVSLLVISTGYIFRGGISFRFCGVSLRRNADLKPASPARCAIRNWVSWFPVTLGLTCLGMLIQYGLILNQQQAESLEVAPPITFFALLISLPIVFLITLFGVGYSILRPSRGIADLICGTRLMRK